MAGSRIALTGGGGAASAVSPGTPCPPQQQMLLPVQLMPHTPQFFFKGVVAAKSALRASLRPFFPRGAGHGRWGQDRLHLASRYGQAGCCLAPIAALPLPIA